MKIYNKPISEEIRMSHPNLLMNSKAPIPSENQCDCTQHRLYGGCNNCDPKTCNCGECN